MLYLAFALALLTPALAATIESVSVPGCELFPLWDELTPARAATTGPSTSSSWCAARPASSGRAATSVSTPAMVRPPSSALTPAPANGQLLTFQPCNRRAPGQAWWLTDDGRIALQDQGFCVDLPAGTGENQDAVQIWRCGDGNINQAWVVGGAGASA
ncbi:unnamed protein product [Cutaneotrichosporon oleaginosum]